MQRPPRYSTARLTSIIGLVIGAALLPLSGSADGSPLAFVQVSSTADRSPARGIDNSILAGRYPQGARIVRAESENIVHSLRVVTDGFACATDPMFSYDGSRMAFSGYRKDGEHLGIWELVDDGSDAESVFAGAADCVQPLYLPNGDVVFTSLLSREYEEHGGLSSFSLYALALGADSPTRLTFNPSSDFDPVVLPDGRVLYSSWQHVGNHHWPRGTVALMLINSDGTGVFPLTGNHRGPWLKRGAMPWIDGSVVFIVAARADGFGAGALMATSLNDAFAEYRTLIPADQYQVSDVLPLPDGRLIVSARPTDNVRTTFGLYLYEGGKVTLLYDDPGYHELSPALGGRRTPPDLRVSVVVPDTPYGYLTVLDCRETDRTDQHSLQKRRVGSVRVIEGLPLRRGDGEEPMFFSVPGREEEPLIRPNSATGYIPARILGEVPPASDGSVYLKVPADRPLRIQLIDRSGFSIVNERAWFWVRPNERRVCIGCHEDRELGPRNTVPIATRHVATDLTDPSGWETVSFRQDIQPILTANCAVTDCHIPPTPTAGLNQTADRLNASEDAVLADRFGPVYANFLLREENKPFGIGGRRVHPGDSRSSPMLWMLYGRALAPQYRPAPFKRPMVEAHPGPMLPESLLELIRKWIDLGAQYDDESPPGPWPYSIPPAQTVLVKETPDAK